MSNDFDLSTEPDAAVLESENNLLDAQMFDSMYQISHNDLREEVLTVKGANGSAYINRDDAPEWAIETLEAEGIEIHDIGTCTMCASVDDEYYWVHFDE